MLKVRLLHAVCGIALLASVPAFAQPQRPGGDLVSSSGVPNPNAKQPATGPLAPQNNGANTTSMASPPATTAPAAKSGTETSGKSGTDSSAMMDKHPMHHEAMRHEAMRHKIKGEKTDTSQDGAVDHLNDQSYKAASQGEAFKVAGSEGMSQSSAPMQSGTMSSGASSGGSMPASGAMTNPTK
jgi:hypothetical protein